MSNEPREQDALNASRQAPTAQDFRTRFYESYASTHTLHRKGRPTSATFSAKAGAWDKRLGALLPESSAARIIDLGCGSGSLVWWLQARGFEGAEGIDASGEQVALAREAGVRHVVKADLRNWLADHDGYDLVFLRDVLEHFDRNDAVALLDQLHSAIAPDGRVVIQVPNAESPMFGRIRYGDCTHEMAYTPASLTQVLGITGFRVLDFLTVPPVLLGRRSIHRYILWKVVELFYRILNYAESGKWPPVVSQAIIVVAQRSDT